MTSVKLDDNGRRLVEENMKLVPYTIRLYYGAGNIANDDMMSDGYLGLCKAAMWYKPDAGTKFSTYAVMCIVNQIKRESKKRFNPKRYSEIQPISLDQTIEEYGDKSVAYTIKDRAVDVESEAINNVICKSIEHIIPTYLDVHSGRMTVDGVAKRDGVSKKTVYSKMDRELRKARSALAAQGLTA